MRDFVITADSNCDLPQEYVDENQIGIIPHYYDIDGVTYGDEKNLTPKEFYDLMRAGKMPTTMASNPAVIRDTFKNYADKGLDVLHFSFSSALSGGHSNVVCGAQEICEENPGMKIRVVDTLNVSLGEGMVVMKAVRMKKEGKSLDEIADWVEAHKQEFCVYFVVDDLFHLHRGGRLSKTTAIVGSVLNIKPVLIVDAEGKLVNNGTARGRKKALNVIVDRAVASMGTQYLSDDWDLCVVHGDSLEDAKMVADALKEKTGKTAMINTVSPSIGAHAGPAALGILCMGKSRG
ncbi:MAG: DegV family protein [Lachnospiraceae bacterium]|nr:DegV family protein [Lachnospiraceae bacterium]